MHIGFGGDNKDTLFGSREQKNKREGGESKIGMTEFGYKLYSMYLSLILV
jgi:hypothetical protein